MLWSHHNSLIWVFYYSRDIIHIHLRQTTFREFYGRHTDLVHKCDTSVSHMLNGLFTNCDIRLVSSYLVWIVTGATCGAENSHSFRNTWLLSLWGVHDLPIHYILLNLSVLALCLRINDWFVCLDLSDCFVSRLIIFNLSINLIN